MNPVKGGKPPKDKSTRGTRIEASSDFVVTEASVLIVVEVVSVKPRKTAVVIAKYNMSVKRLSNGENCMTIVIHPKCAIEE